MLLCYYKKNQVLTVALDIVLIQIVLENIL